MSARSAASSTTPGCASPGYARGAGDAILRGGRYDDLVGRYGRAARAIGFAVDVEAIASAQRAAEVARPSPPAVLVVPTWAGRGDAARLAAALRGAGLRAAVDLAGGRSDAQVLTYARAPASPGS
ncbi:MAG: ATP phosphoribosyltransferase regulatory subunit [Kofleriaceae bacterium]|nr:ATP phosphoribosyltransferase regulatory subunit [Kofleriaceae bacterium]